ncbi:hypothetical protein BJY59DRAFT_390654 [Rhodotorula toruloides]
MASHDSRPLPDGWIEQYDSNHQRTFWVDTKVHPHHVVFGPTRSTIPNISRRSAGDTRRRLVHRLRITRLRTATLPTNLLRRLLRLSGAVTRPPLSSRPPPMRATRRNPQAEAGCSANSSPS